VAYFFASCTTSTSDSMSIGLPELLENPPKLLLVTVCAAADTDKAIAAASTTKFRGNREIRFIAVVPASGRACSAKPAPQVRSGRCWAPLATALRAALLRHSATQARATA